MIKEVKKAIIPVAGWGTRSLPASKNVPKEMLPVYNKPAVQHIVEEVINSGIKDVIFITSKNKSIIEDHFDYNLALEWVLERQGKTKLLEEVRKVSEMINIISVRQKKQLGLGHAVYCAKDLIKKDEAFAVILGDDLIFNSVPGIKQLLDVAEREDMCVVGVMPVKRNKVSRYGIIKGEEISPNLYRVIDIVEKPKVDEAPSNLAVVGRYILTPVIFDFLEELIKNHSEENIKEEIQLTSALQVLAKKRKLLAVKLKGIRFDIGDWAEYLVANLYFGLQDPELKEDLKEKINEFLNPSLILK